MKVPTVIVELLRSGMATKQTFNPQIGVPLGFDNLPSLSDFPVNVFVGVTIIIWIVRENTIGESSLNQILD